MKFIKLAYMQEKPYQLMLTMPDGTEIPALISVSVVSKADEVPVVHCQFMLDPDSMIHPMPI